MPTESPAGWRQAIVSVRRIWDLHSYVAGQFGWLSIPAYSETAVSGSSSVALTYQHQTTNDTRGEIGLNVDKTTQFMEDATLQLTGRAGYAHELVEQ